MGYNVTTFALSHLRLTNKANYCSNAMDVYCKYELIGSFMHLLLICVEGVVYIVDRKI
jgi:hypothetical protein